MFMKLNQEGVIIRVLELSKVSTSISSSELQNRFPIFVCACFFFISNDIE